MSVHPMQKDKFGFAKLKIHPTVLRTHMEPKSPEILLGWNLKAIKVEYNALIGNGTWPLVKLPPHNNLTG